MVPTALTTLDRRLFVAGPKTVCTVLGETTTAKTRDKLRMIATVYELEADRRHKPKRVTPERIERYVSSVKKDGWPKALKSDSNLEDRVKRAVAGEKSDLLLVLPFNYA